MTNCPNCNSSGTVVKDSRPSEYRNTIVIKRRRLCLECKNRYTTYELSEEIIKITEAKNLPRTLGRVRLLLDEMSIMLKNETE